MVLFAPATGNALPSFRALVDSGADRSLFPLSYLTPLGVDIADCQEITDGEGAGGVATYYFWPDAKLKGRVAKWQLEVDAWFSATKLPLLGREDFFALFTSVSFNQNARTFTIEE